MLEKEATVLSSDAHCFTKSIPIAILSYSNYLPPHNHHLWFRGQTHHFIISPIQWVRGLEKVQQRYLVSALQCLGTHLGQLNSVGDSAAGPRPIERKAHSLSYPEVGAACHLRSQLGLLARAPTHGISRWSLCLFTAWWPGSRSKCPKICLLVMVVWEDQESHFHRNKYKTGQPYQKQPFQVTGK